MKFLPSFIVGESPKTNQKQKKKCNQKKGMKVSRNIKFYLWRVEYQYMYEILFIC